MSENNYTDYYNQPEFWLDSRNETPQEKARIAAIIDAVPSDAQSILEVGCGNGAIGNRLIGTRKVVGIDISEVAMQHARFSCMVASADQLPFDDGSFDMIIASEVLEHLPETVFAKALREMCRVASRYILVTVPNEEPIDLMAIRCPHCHCTFHPYRHVRSFNPEKMGQLFQGFTPVKIATIGIREKAVVNLTLRARRALLGVPPARLTSEICPQCGERPVSAEMHAKTMQSGQKEVQRKRGWRDLARMFYPKKWKEPWLMALVKKGPASTAESKPERPSIAIA